MKLFEKLRRTTDPPGDGDLPPRATPTAARTADPGSDPDAAGGVPGAGLGVDVDDDPPTERSAGGAEPNDVAAPPSSARAGRQDRYDPTCPAHSPVAGVDLLLFATVTHQLRVAPAGRRTALLARHGHTPETWSAVNTVWMARLGQMPYLCATFDAAALTAVGSGKSGAPDGG